MVHEKAGTYIVAIDTHTAHQLKHCKQQIGGVIDSSERDGMRLVGGRAHRGARNECSLLGSYMQTHTTNKLVSPSRSGLVGCLDLSLNDFVPPTPLMS